MYVANTCGVFHKPVEQLITMKGNDVTQLLMNFRSSPRSCSCSLGNFGPFFS